MRLDAVAIAAGLLHDVVEDTLTTIERIEELFGPEVAHVVEGVTKISAISFSSKEARQAETFRKMLLAMVDDIRVILVKLADRLHNMRTLDHLPEDRRTRIAQETADIYAPIANRLGMSKLKNELEELAFKALEPGPYLSLKEQGRDQAAVTEGAIEELKTTIAPKLTEAQVPLREIDGRIKRLYSISPEAETAAHRARAGLRPRRHPHRHRLGEGLLRRARHHPSDLAADSGPDQGLHRDAAAQRLSVAAHLGGERPRPAVRGADPHRRHAPRWPRKALPRTGSTRKGRVGAQRDEQYFRWLRQLIEWQQEVRDPQEFIQNLKIDLYPEEVYCFTPRGEVKALPRGATPVDFAYAIHTDIGHQCVGAKVNGNMVPLRHQLKNGDIVEILTQPGHKPSRDWLAFVGTSRARQKIRHLIEGEEKSRSIEIGKKMFEKEARRYEISREAPDRRSRCSRSATTTGTRRSTISTRRLATARPPPSSS